MSSEVAVPASACKRQIDSRHRGESQNRRSGQTESTSILIRLLRIENNIGRTHIRRSRAPLSGHLNVNIRTHRYIYTCNADWISSFNKKDGSEWALSIQWIWNESISFPCRTPYVAPPFAFHSINVIQYAENTEENETTHTHCTSDVKCPLRGYVSCSHSPSLYSLFLLLTFSAWILQFFGH